MIGHRGGYLRGFRSAPRATITNPDCISVLYTVCGFWGKNRRSAANAELRKTLKSQGESARAQPGKTPFLIYKTVALPLSYIGFAVRNQPHIQRHLCWSSMSEWKVNSSQFESIRGSLGPSKRTQRVWP